MDRRTVRGIERTASGLQGDDFYCGWLFRPPAYLYDLSVVSGSGIHLGIKP